jgi:transposase
MNITNKITYIGVDIAKSKFDICIYNGNFSSCVYQSYSNDLDGFGNFFSLLNSLNHLKDIRIGLEATSTYMIKLQIQLDLQNIKYLLLNPKKLHHYIKYKHTESKTDKLDSYYIADYITNLKDKSFNSSHSKTKLLYKTYNAYINMIIKTETHIKGITDSVMSDDFISPSLKTEILSFNDNLAKTKKKVLKEALEVIKISMPEYDHIKNDLNGVGDKTLLAVLPLIYEISDSYSMKKLQSFIGLNPVYKDSGSSVHKKQVISKAGNKEARKMLYMASLSSIQQDGILKDKYERLLANGKPKKVALVAISAHIFRAIVTKLNYYKKLNK